MKKMSLSDRMNDEVNKQVLYYTRKYEKYYDNESDELKCGLEGGDVDDNFHIINGEHIKAIKFNNDRNKIQIIRNNEEFIECAFKLENVYNDEDEISHLQLIGSFYDEDKKSFNDVVLSVIDVANLIKKIDGGTY